MRDVRDAGLTGFEPMPYGYVRWNGGVWVDSWVDRYNRELERAESRFVAGMDVSALVDGLYNLANGFDVASLGPEVKAL